MRLAAYVFFGIGVVVDLVTVFLAIQDGGIEGIETRWRLLAVAGACKTFVILLLLSP